MDRQKQEELILLYKLAFLMASPYDLNDPHGPFYINARDYDQSELAELSQANNVGMFLIMCVYLTNTSNMKLETGGNWTDYPDLIMDNNYNNFLDGLETIILTIRQNTFENVFPIKLRENLATKLEDILKSGDDVLIKFIYELKSIIFNFNKEDILTTAINNEVRNRGMKALQDFKTNLGLFEPFEQLWELFEEDSEGHPREKIVKTMCKIDGIWPPGMSPPSEKAGGRKRYRSKKMRKNNYRRSLLRLRKFK